jgi:hypothetical protein
MPVTPFPPSWAPARLTFAYRFGATAAEAAPGRATAAMPNARVLIILFMFMTLPPPPGTHFRST